MLLDFLFTCPYVAYLYCFMEGHFYWGSYSDIFSLLTYDFDLLNGLIFD